MEIRIQRISINNIKNIRHGEIVFDHLEEYNHVTGIYGANASGKSGLVAAFKLIGHFISNVEGTKPSFVGLITKGESKATIELELILNDDFFILYFEMMNIDGELKITKQRVTYKNIIEEDVVHVSNFSILQKEQYINIREYLNTRFIVIDENFYNNNTLDLLLYTSKQIQTIFGSYPISRIKGINHLLSTLIPGTRIVLEKEGEYFRLLSNYKENTIPLKDNSTGVKRLIILLSSLIVAFKEKSSFVVIDEFDASIFEYLFGELLSVLDKYSQGQLLFVSHNLRALEVLDKKSIYFATNNPFDKFIRFLDIKEGENIRSLYLRALSLGDEGLKDEVEEKDIVLAFLRASKENEF